MPSLKDLKNRIGSVKSTQKITKAMQLVAAAKLKRAQDAATAARPYAERLAAVLANLAATTGQGGPKLLTGNGNDQTHRQRKRNCKKRREQGSGKQRQNPEMFIGKQRCPLRVRQKINNRNIAEKQNRF